MQMVSIHPLGGRYKLDEAEFTSYMSCITVYVLVLCMIFASYFLTLKRALTQKRALLTGILDVIPLTWPWDFACPRMVKSKLNQMKYVKTVYEIFIDRHTV